MENLFLNPSTYICRVITGFKYLKIPFIRGHVAYYLRKAAQYVVRTIRNQNE